MYLIEVKPENTEIIKKIAELHYVAYSEKFPKENISHDIKDYINETMNDTTSRKTFTNKECNMLIVCEDRTDKLLKNSTYHLVTRIFVSKDMRKNGNAKKMIKYCQDKLGPLMGYDGKFYTIGEIQ